MTNINRRVFLKKAFLCAGSIYVSHRFLLKILHARSLASVKKWLFCVTNTSNWVLVNGIRRNLYEYKNDGLNNYATWSSIETKSGKYDWHGLDRMYKEAQNSNKKLSYNILAGKHTPSWVYSEINQEPFSYEVATRSVKTFLPWKVQNGALQLNLDILNVWRQTIIAFANKIYSLPDRSIISYIAITGGPTANGLEIMWGQDIYADFSKIGWNPQKELLFVEYWKCLIDIFYDNFPDIPLGLAFTDFYGVEANGKIHRSYTIPDSILSYAIQTAKVRNRTVVPMILWIGKLKPPFDSHPGLKLLKKLSVPFAIQGEMGTDTTEQLEAILKYAQDNNVLWVELWHQDFINPKYDKIIKEF